MLSQLVTCKKWQMDTSNWPSITKKSECTNNQLTTTLNYSEFNLATRLSIRDGNISPHGLNNFGLTITGPI